MGAAGTGATGAGAGAVTAAEGTGAGDVDGADASDDVLGRARPGLTLGALDRKMGVQVLEASAERLVATMPVETNTQSYGRLHGGAMAALAEAAGSWAAVIHAGPGRSVVGVDLSATHHRGATEGVVTATATPLHRGRTLATYEVVLTDAAGRRLCTARMTSLIGAAAPPGPAGAGDGEA